MTQTDAAGNTGPAGTDSFTVDTTAPAKPTITGPTANSSTTDTTPTITGTGDPGATIRVSVNGKVVGTTTVAADGTWSVTVTAPLAVGAHTVTAVQTDAAGNVSQTSSPLAITITASSTTTTSGSATSSPGSSGSGGSGSTGSLARTGAEAGLLALIGAVLLVGGFGLTTRRRRRS